MTYKKISMNHPWIKELRNHVPEDEILDNVQNVYHQSGRKWPLYAVSINERKDDMRGEGVFVGLSFKKSPKAWWTPGMATPPELFIMVVTEWMNGRKA